MTHFLRRHPRRADRAEEEGIDSFAETASQRLIAVRQAVERAGAFASEEPEDRGRMQGRYMPLLSAVPILNSCASGA